MTTTATAPRRVQVTKASGPKRVQRTRRRGGGMPAGAVYVGRINSTPQKWGNPFTTTEAIDAGFAKTIAQARTVCTDWFRAWLDGTLAYGPGPSGTAWSAERREWILGHLQELRGRDLACWCPVPMPGRPDHCHAAVLLEKANAPR